MYINGLICSINLIDFAGSDYIDIDLDTYIFIKGGRTVLWSLL
uniref:Uncharacterized protein n=1 Tax=Anguilla anguilla TaxID=7936 RepID=A0A0E9VKK9_ANGAN